MAPAARRAPAATPRSPRAPRPTSHAPYRAAHRHGQLGQKMPEGLGARADQDPNIDKAYDAGANGYSFEDFANENLQDEPTGPRPRRSEGRRPGGSSRAAKRRGGRSLSSRSAIPSSAPSPPGLRAVTGAAGGGATGLILGVVLYALILSVGDYGPKGPILWLKAKFLNIPASQSSSSSSGSASASSPAAGQSQQAALAAAPSSGPAPTGVGNSLHG